MSDFQSAKAVVRAHHASIDAATGDDIAAVMAANITQDHLWRGYFPFHEVTNGVDAARQFWAPLKTALTSMQRREDIFFAGLNQIDDGQTTWVVSMGHLMGNFDQPWLGIRPTRKLTMLRYCEFNRVEGDKIAETALYIDIPHVMVQAGQNPFAPQTGQHLVQPGPRSGGGVLRDPQDPAEGRATMDAINAMVTDIARWSGGKSEPLVEELRRTWHEDMLWWGPEGIGASYTIPRYAEQHSGPFRAAFVERKFNGHVAKLAEGAFGGFFGWPNLAVAHHGGFMGMPETDTWADMRVIDIYRREGDKLAENWIFIDLLYFWHQQGVDILGRATGIEGMGALQGS